MSFKKSTQKIHIKSVPFINRTVSETWCDCSQSELDLLQLHGGSGGGWGTLSPLPPLWVLFTYGHLPKRGVVDHRPGEGLQRQTRQVLVSKRSWVANISFIFLFQFVFVLFCLSVCFFVLTFEISLTL